MQYTIRGNQMELGHFWEYKKQLEQAVYDLDPDPIMGAADILFEAWNNKRSVYVFGNGGSWSTAEHFACDLRKWSRIPGSGGVRAQALTLTPLATAYANDHNYSEVFSRQLNDVMQDGDVAIGISCSGTSANVLAGLSLAELFGTRILLTTNDPPVVKKQVADLVIRVGGADIRVQEDMHLAVCHILAGEVRVRIAEVAQRQTA
jgi:D-sedoheptulose 7-phosphate isomerase